MRKKILLGLLYLASFSLAACSCSGSTESSESTEPTKAHVHEYKFDSFEWTMNPGAYTAKAKYVCKENKKHVEYHDAEIVKKTVASTCTADGKNTYTASYDGHEESKVEVLHKKGHEANEIGYCGVCGEYIGVDVDVDDIGGCNTFTLSIEPKLEKDKTYYFRVSGVRKGHSFRLEDSDWWTEGVQPEVLAAEIKAYTLVGKTVKPYAYNAAGNPSETAPEIGEDGYVYFVAKPTKGWNSNVNLYFVEDHMHTPIGQCYGEGCAHEICEALPASITFAADGETSYYYTIYAQDNVPNDFTILPGHLYCWQSDDDDDLKEADVTCYYILEGTKEPVEYDCSDYLPDDVTGRLYFVIKHNHAANNGSISVTMDSHNDEHGFCTYCQNPTGQQLEFETNNPVVLTEGDPNNLWIDIGFPDPEQVIDFSVHSSVELFLYDAETDTFNFTLYTWDPTNGFKEVDVYYYNSNGKDIEFILNDTGETGVIMLVVTPEADGNTVITIASET